jgi:hypothetical protein
MARCENCGNDYSKTFSVRFATGPEHIFDSFECAVRTLAPECYHCGTKILGHGVEVDEKIFCCAHCARQEGETALVDHAALEGKVI